MPVIDSTLRIHKVVPIKLLATDTLEVSFIASHMLRPDAESELVDVNGIDLDRFRRNPVLLLQHDRSTPVARGVSLTRQSVEGALALTGVGRFTKDDDESVRAYRQVKAGLLNGVSIGFLSLEQGPPVLPGQRGPTHIRTELLEISLVTMPSCPTCVVTQKMARYGDDDPIMRIGPTGTIVVDTEAMGVALRAELTKVRQDIDDTVRRTVAQPPMRMTRTQLGRELAEAVRDHVNAGIKDGVRVAFGRARGNIDFF